jgi:hypothetical protein
VETFRRSPQGKKTIFRLRGCLLLVLGVRENRILNGNTFLGRRKDSKTNVCVCVICMLPDLGALLNKT